MSNKEFPDFNYELNSSLLHIGKKFAGIRHTRNEKLMTVARAINVSHSVISEIENGRYIGLSMALLIKLASYYQITLNELFVSAPGETGT